MESSSRCRERSEQVFRVPVIAISGQQKYPEYISLSLDVSKSS